MIQVELDYIHVSDPDKVGNYWKFDIILRISGGTEFDLSQDWRTIDSDGNVPIVVKTAEWMDDGCREKSFEVEITATEGYELVHDTGGTTETVTFKCDDDNAHAIIEFDVFESGLTGVDRNTRTTVEVGLDISSICAEAGTQIEESSKPPSAKQSGRKLPAPSSRDVTPKQSAEETTIVGELFVCFEPSRTGVDLKLVSLLLN